MRLDKFFSLSPCVSSRLWSLPIYATRAKFSRHCRADSGSLSLRVTVPVFFFFFGRRRELYWFGTLHTTRTYYYHSVLYELYEGLVFFFEKKNSSLPYHPEIPPRFGSWESGVSRGMIWMRGPTTHAGNPLGSSRLIALHKMLVFHYCVYYCKPRDEWESLGITEVPRI